MSLAFQSSRVTHRVLLVDDHKILRDGIRAILQRCDQFKIAGEAESGSDAIDLCRRNKYDVILMDLSLPGVSGITAILEILREQPEVKIIVLSMYDDQNSLIRAIRAGARGYVLKNSSDTELVEALGVVAKGGVYLSSAVSIYLMKSLQEGDGCGPKAHPAISTLSPRETQVLRLISQGMSNKEIASTLALSVETIRTYRKTMMCKLRVSNVAELTTLAISEGLSEEPYQSGPRLDEHALRIPDGEEDKSAAMVIAGEIA